MRFMPPGYAIIPRKIPVYEEWTYILVQRINNVEHQRSTSLSRRYQQKAAWRLWSKDVLHRKPAITRLLRVFRGMHIAPASNK